MTNRKKPRQKPEFSKVLETHKETVAVSELKPAPYNPRGISPEAEQSLRRSIEKFGLAGDIVWNRQTGHVISGHQRLAILKEKGYDAMSVIVLDLSLEEEKALNAHMNNPAAQGYFTRDIESLLDEIRNGRPDLYDDLRLFDIKGEGEEEPEPQNDLEQERTLRELEIRPFEHWDYLVFVFDNDTDWNNATTRLDIDKRSISPSPKHQKVGLGRVLKGDRLVRLLEFLTDEQIAEVLR